MPEPNIKIITNRQFWLNARDFAHGAFMAVGGAVTKLLYDVFTDPVFVFNPKGIAKAAVGAMLLYLMKNFFTPSNTTVQIASQDPKALSASMKDASNISIDKVDGKVSKIETTAG